MNVPERQFDFRLPLLITLLCFIFTYFFFGFYYVEYEGLNIGFISGSLTPGMPFRSVYFSGNLVISQFYSLLYENFPGIEWMSWLENLWMLLASVLSMQAISVLLPQKISTARRIAIMVSMFVLVFADHHIHLIYTRVAYLVCGASLVGLTIFFNDRGVIKKRWGWFLLFNLFFAIGTFIRNEAALACFLLMIPFSLLFTERIKHTAMLFLFPLLVVGGQSLFLAIDIKTATNTEFYKQVEPDIEEQFIARGNMVPLARMKTYRDTVMHQMGAQMLLSDPRVMTPVFLRSLILPENFIFTDARQWNRVAREQKAILLQYWHLALVVILLSAALLSQYSFRKQKTTWLFCAAFVVSYWALTLVQTYVDKVNERSWVPYIGLFILCHLLLLVKNMRPDFSGRVHPLLIACGILFLVHIYHLKKESVRLKEDLEMKQQQFEEIKKLASGRFLAINSSVLDYFFLSCKPFHPVDFSAFKKFYITDGYIIPFFPYYKRYLENECKCDIYSYPSFWNYLNTANSDVLIVSEEERMRVIKNYLREIHGLDLSLREVNVTGNTSYEWKTYLLNR